MSKELEWSLWDNYKKKSAVWHSYYRMIINVDKLFATDKSEEECRGFIEEHFRSGNKEMAFQYPESIKEKCLRGMRTVHMTSLYLLGDYLYDIFGEALYKGLEDEGNLNIKSRGEWYQKEYFFKYIWFLTCLYHDVTSNVEEDEEFKRIANEYFENKTSKSQKDTIYEHYCVDGKLFQPRFNYGTISEYYDKRKKEGKYDHGIIAGYLLFEKLKKNFEEKTKGHDMRKEIVYDKDKKIQWRLEQMDIFAYVSDAIICHNLWMAYTPDDKAKYKSNGLDKLIIKDDKSNRLSLEEYPLQFMLCLLDTIEPIKRFCNDRNEMNYKDCLQNIYIADMSENGVRKLIISWSNIMKKNSNFKTWLKNIHELSKWMQVEVSECYSSVEKCCIDISF